MKSEIKKAIQEVLYKYHPQLQRLHIYLKITDLIPALNLKKSSSQLHRQRQERVKRAAQEAGEEVEDVFSLYEESKETTPVYSDLKIPESESPEKIVEELVSDTFRTQENPATSAKQNDEVIEHQLYEEDLQAEKQNAELRQSLMMFWQKKQLWR